MWRIRSLSILIGSNFIPTKVIPRKKLSCTVQATKLGQDRRGLEADAVYLCDFTALAKIRPKINDSYNFFQVSKAMASIFLSFN